MYFTFGSSRLLLYDVNSWDLKKSYWCYAGILRDLSWSDDSKYILQVNSKGVVDILSPADHSIKSLQHIPIKDSWSACFHRDGHRNIAVGTRSGNVMVWDTKVKCTIKTFPTPAQQSCVNYISYNAKNTSLAANMQNGETIIYGLASNIPILTVKLACSKSISAMKFHHDSRSLLGFATDDGHIVIRDVNTNKDKVFFENVHASPISDIAYSLVNKDVMLSSGYDKIMHVYDVRIQNVVSTIRTQYTLTSVAVNPENLVALGTKTGLVLIYDLRDLVTPFQVLKGPEEEVKRVAFQPARKKMLSADISLREEPETNVSPLKVVSPSRHRSSEIFFNNNSPPKVNIELSPAMSDNKADSFLAMMGLDKSNDGDEDTSKTEDLDRKSDRLDLRYRQLDSDKNISNKISTPLNSRTVEKLRFSSPLITNGISDEGKTSSTNNVSALIKQSGSNQAVMDSQTVEELKDFVKLTVADVADDNRNYFLHIMMALTKQKLYLEKQLASVSGQLESLVHNQNALVEANRKLALEIDQLKAGQNLL